ncbi:MAG: membrane protein insertion efficiency factor YidD [Spirochaetae bacterium HGW-Spirochaetae-7]|nr:MAG: membrane protein insertion efficiency factor YidD [Spirochaetae bacterium HGW-Spirochaetae-7]
MHRAFAVLLKAVIRFYRAALSPLKPRSCRFHPTCSAYALEAIERYGAAKGGILTMKRILRCNPFHPGGFDPVL